MSVIDTGNALPTAPAVVREQSGGDNMRAIVLNGFGGLDSLVYTHIPKPLPKDGEVVIAVRDSESITPRCTCAGANGPKPQK